MSIVGANCDCVVEINDAISINVAKNMAQLSPDDFDRVATSIISNVEGRITSIYCIVVVTYFIAIK